MLAALAIVIPLGLAGAVSPVMLTEQSVLLANPDGGRAAVRYAAGVVVTALVIVVAFGLFGRAISLPTEPHLDATLDLVLGLVLSAWPFSLSSGDGAKAGCQVRRVMTTGVRAVCARLERRFRSACSPWRRTSRRWP